MINRTEARYGEHDVNAPAMCLRTPVDDAVACSDKQNTTFQHPPPGHVFLWVAGVRMHCWKSTDVSACFFLND